MHSLSTSDCRTIYGGTTYYTCKCGYTCTKRTSCISHMIKKHPGEILSRWYKLFKATVKLFS